MPLASRARARVLVLIVAVAAAPFVDALAQPVAPETVAVTHLRTEYKENPLGIDVRQPRLSWRLTATARAVVQSAYQVRVAETSAALAKQALWDSGRVESGASTHRPYEGPALQSGRRYHWQVRVWDGHGKPSAWSDPGWWEMGLLSPADWKAAWIGPTAPDAANKVPPSPMLRGTFRLQGPVASARAYVSALGLYEIAINGRRVGDEVFTPGWTSYDTRVQYQTYDVTALLQPGDNAVGAMLGEGWYRGTLAWENNRAIYGKDLALIAQIAVTYRNGRTQVFGTGRTWTSSTGPILMSGIYDGETYDARLEKPGWTMPGFDTAGWTPVRVIDHPKTVLIAPAGPPVRRIEEIKPVKILRTPAGETVFDMGQNMVGWVRLSVSGAAGTTVTLRHAEVLDAAGNFYTENLRMAAQTTTYTLKGGGPETWEPRFTFQGFRYVAVSGLPNPSIDHLTGVVIHSDTKQTGRFETSHPLLNQLQKNIWWGQRGNFLDVPTDCPQRDERLGWTGDAQVFARTAAFNADVAPFFTKWLADLAADQKPSGAVPHVIPDVLTHGRPEGGGATGWSDAAVVVPWTMYLVYGDTRILETQYDSMKKWVGYMRKEAGESHVWRTGQHFGDWLAFATTRSDYPGATTDKDLLATAYFAHSTTLLARIARVLGRDADAHEYDALAARVREAFMREFVTPNGRLASNTQTAYVLALSFDLLPEPMRGQAAQRLADDVRSHGNHLTTGFLGTPDLAHVLSRFGHLATAYALLLQESYPSWLYPVKKGATTIWERWDGIKPDGSFQDKGMNSFNHYAYGAIGAWMYSVVAGLDLDPAEPGYRRIRIAPRPGGGLTRASATYESLHGEVTSAWTIEGGAFTVKVTVPPNTRAQVTLPNATAADVREGSSPVGQAAGVSNVRQHGSAVQLEIGSGSYTFTYPAR